MDPEKLFTDNMKLVHYIIKTHFPNLTLSGGGGMNMKIMCKLGI